MSLTLTRPLVFFDLETTGVNISQDRIVELSLVKQHPDGHLESRTWRINPGMHIPAEASAVHHITDADVAHCPHFADKAEEILAFIKNSDLAGYNSNHFDVPLLQEELLRAGCDYDIKKEHHLIDAFVIFQKHTPRTLTAAYKHYCGKDLEGAHGANADTLATREVLLAQLQQHRDVPQTVEDLEKYTTVTAFADMAGRLCYDANGVVCFNFGKYKGQSVKDVFLMDGSYYAWMINGDFPEYTKRIITEIKGDIRKMPKTERNQARTDIENRVSAPTAESLNRLAERFSHGQKGNKRRKAASNNKNDQPTLF